jgi:hypothetical protein
MCIYIYVRLYVFKHMCIFKYFYIYDDDDVYLKKIAKRMSQKLIRHKNADKPKPKVREST